MLLAGCLVLLIQGTWDLAKYQAEMRKEKIRLEQLGAAGLEVDGMKSSIRTKIYLSAAMAVAGAFGLFVYISRSTRKQTDQSINSKTQNKS